jgi:hypothetical protein
MNRHSIKRCNTKIRYTIKCCADWYFYANKNAWGLNKESATLYYEEDLPFELPHPLMDGECMLDNCAIGSKHIWIDYINQKIATVEEE